MKKDPRGSFFFLAPQVRGRDAESMLGESGLIKQLKKQLAERLLGAELNHHLATERASGDETGRWRAPWPLDTVALLPFTSPQSGLQLC
jgi:hypothetical protein